MNWDVSDETGEQARVRDEAEVSGVNPEAQSTVESDDVEPTSEVKVRFVVADNPNDSVTDAGIDDFQVDVLFCDDEEPCEGDANGDGVVNPLDSGFVLARFGCPVGTGDPGCDAADQNGDGEVNPLDSGFVLARFGPCE